MQILLNIEKILDCTLPRYGHFFLSKADIERLDNITKSAEYLTYKCWISENNAGLLCEFRHHDSQPLTAYVKKSLLPDSKYWVWQELPLTYNLRLLSKKLVLHINITFFFRFITLFTHKSTKISAISATISMIKSNILHAFTFLL